jgi:hypothetical protein
MRGPLSSTRAQTALLIGTSSFVGLSQRQYGLRQGARSTPFGVLLVPWRHVPTPEGAGHGGLPDVHDKVGTD